MHWSKSGRPSTAGMTNGDTWDGLPHATLRSPRETCARASKRFSVVSGSTPARYDVNRMRSIVL